MKCARDGVSIKARAPAPMLRKSALFDEVGVRVKIALWLVAMVDLFFIQCAVKESFCVTLLDEVSTI